MGFTNLLHHPATIHLRRKLKDPGLHLRRQSLLLQLLSVLEALLNNVVAVDVHHQLNGVWLDFRENAVLLVGGGRRDLVLDEPRAMLVSTELGNMSKDVLGSLSVHSISQCKRGTQ